MYTQLYVKDVWLLCYLILFPKSLSILLCTWKFVALHACESLKSLDSIFECKLHKICDQAFSSSLHFEFTLWFLLNFVRMIPWIVIPLNNHNTSYWSNDRWRQNPATKQFFVFDILYSQLLFLSVQLNIEEMLEAIIYLIQKQRYVLAEYFAAFSLWFQFDLSRSWDLCCLIQWS